MDLAADIVNSAYRSLPYWLESAVIERLQFGILDTVAVALHGGSTPEVQHLRQTLLDHNDTTTMWLTGADVSPERKAFFNALPITAEQLQDGHRLARGHPFAHLVPTCLAAAEFTSAKLPTILEGLLLGYEVGVRLGISMHGTPEGIHDIGTWGLLGATVGYTHILTTGDQALGAAGLRLASGVVLGFDAETVFDGFSASHLYLATACQLAIQFAMTAALGTTTAPGTLERHWLPHLASQQVPLHETWTQAEITNGYFKIYPTVAHTHGTIDAIHQFLQQVTPWMSQGQLQHQIASIQVSTYGSAAQFCNQRPQSVDACRFSIPFIVATAIVDGQISPTTDFTRALQTQQVRDFAERISVVEDASLTARYPLYGRPTRVVVEFVDGTRHETSCDLTSGDGPGALTNPDVVSKPDRLVTGIVSPSSWQTFSRTIMNLGQTNSPQIFDALTHLTRSE
ncbi:MAG: MmgE/PrpD family protein [Ferrimicrobium sp.]|jgi:2-methylcitrate dehydratase PrpD|nr:MmgE/PrpD family protein [Ferrimicrobium sp.]